LQRESKGEYVVNINRQQLDGAGLFR